MNKKWKVRNKKRLTCSVSILAMVFILCVGVLPRWVGADDGIREVIVYAQAGDTLWDICSAHKPDRADLRDYIQKVKYINNKQDSSLTVGEQLRLPKH